MIESFITKDIFDLLYDSAEHNNCYYVYFENRSLSVCDDDSLKNAVYSHYEEFVPEEVVLMMKSGTEKVIRFMSVDSATMNASAWFPTREQLGDLPDEYYFNCYVVDAQGVSYRN